MSRLDIQYSLIYHLTRTELRKQAVTFKELQASLTENMVYIICTYKIFFRHPSLTSSMVENQPHFQMHALIFKKGRHHQRVIANTFGCAHKTLTQDEV